MPLRWMPVTVASGLSLSPRHIASSVVHEKAMYVFGGYNGVHLDELARFQFDKKEWTILNPSGKRPAPRHSHTAVVFQGSMYIFGGISRQSQLLNDICVYNISRNQWVEKNVSGDIPPARWGHSAVIIGDRMYVYGGLSHRDEYMSDVYSFAFDTCLWKKVATKGISPRPRHFHSCVAHGTSFFLFGGYGTSEVKNDFWEFQAESGTWVQLPSTPSIPSNRRGHSAVKYGNTMYLFGGREQAMLKDIFKYDFVTKKWNEVYPRGTFTPKHFHSSVVYGHVIYVLGGVSDKRNLSDFDCLDLAEEDQENLSVIYPQPLPSPLPEPPHPIVSKIRFKCCYEGEFRIIALPYNSSFEDLKSRLLDEYQTNLTIQYKDEEGDMVTIRTQEDLDAARVSLASTQGAFKLFLSQAKVVTAPSSPNPPTAVISALLPNPPTPTPIPTPTPTPSPVIDQSWEISSRDVKMGKKIGQGANGEVYQGVYRGTEVAIKKLFSHHLSEELIREFRAEVQTMFHLRHPNVCLFMGAWAELHDLCIVMEFCARGSLYEVIKNSRPPLPLARRLRVAYDVSLGVSYLHGKKPPIVHRDLKSPNILIDRNWVAKVADFGMSKVKRNTFLSGGPIGTPCWTAPEVIRNEKSNEKADVFSIGVILWELWTLERPFNSLPALQVVGLVGFGKERLSIPHDCDGEYAALIRACFEENPADRPAMESVVGTLETIRKRLSDAAKSPPTQAQIPNAPSEQ